MPFLTKIEQLNSADLAAYRPLILDGDPVGLIWRDNLARLRDHGLDLRDDGDRPARATLAAGATNNCRCSPICIARCAR